MPNWAENLKAIGIPTAPWSLNLKEGNEMDVSLMVELFQTCILCTLIIVSSALTAMHCRICGDKDRVREQFNTLCIQQSNSCSRLGP